MYICAGFLQLVFLATTEHCFLRADIAMRLLQILFSVLWGVGYLGNGILFLYVEWTYLRHSFVQIFNPLLHLQVLGALLTIPLFWIFLVMAVLGYYAATSIEKRLERSNQRHEIKAEQVVSDPLLKNQGVQSSIPTQSPAQNAAQPSRTDTSTQKRPYIQLRFDELKRIADAEWSNVQILNKIHYELEFRSRKKAQALLRERIAQRLIKLQNLQFVWPTTIATTGSQNLPSNVFKYGEGLLRQCGYKVGVSGLPENQRRQILDSVFLQPLAFLDDTTYLNEWGEPNTSRRLQKLAESIAAFTRNAKRRKKRRNMNSLSKAIQDWEADLAYLKRTYYDGHLYFQWPRTGI